MASHTSADVHLFRPDASELRLRREAGYLTLRLAIGVHLNIGDRSWGADPASEITYLRKLASLASEAAAELEHRDHARAVAAERTRTASEQVPS